MTEDQQEFKKQTPDTDLEIVDRRHTALEPVESSSTDIVMAAIQRNLDPKLIEKMMDLAERNENNIARKAYVKAKAAFKKAAPVVIRDMKNKQYDSMYASEDALINTMNRHLGEFGLDVGFDFPKIENGMAVTCILTHELGHSESVTLPGPLDTSGSKNPLQQVKSTVTYLRKATFEAIIGIASSNPVDDDGNAAAGQVDEFITEDQVKGIEKRVKDLYGDEPDLFMTWLKSGTGAETIDTIPAANLEGVQRTLTEQEKTKKTQREPGQEG